MVGYNAFWIPLFFMLTLGFGEGIVDPGGTNDQKPAYSSGIKTTSWVSPTRVQMHQNYSRVSHQNSPAKGGGVTRTVTRTWTTNQQIPAASNQQTNTVYANQHGTVVSNQQTQPVYNGHSYGIIPKDTVVGHKVLVSNGTSSGRHGAIYKVKKEIKHPLEVYSKCPKAASGQFIYSSSCNQFLNCWKGRGFVQTCPPGTLFNPKTLECDFAEKVECVTGPSEVVDFRPQRNVQQASCPAGFVGLIPDYADCSRFINCNGGFATKTDCPPGTLFDMTKNVCDHPYAATCFNGQNLEKLVAGASTYGVHGDGSGQYASSGRWQQGQDGGDRSAAQGAHGHFASLDQISQHEHSNGFSGGWGQHFNEKPRQSPTGSSYQQTTYSGGYGSGQTAGQARQASQTVAGQGNYGLATNQGGQGGGYWQQGSGYNAGIRGSNQATRQGGSQTVHGISSSHGGDQYSSAQHGTSGQLGGQSTYTQTLTNTNQVEQEADHGEQGSFSQQQETYLEGGSQSQNSGVYSHPSQQGTYSWQVVRNATAQGGGNRPNYVQVQNGYNSGQYGGGVSNGQQNPGVILGYGRAPGIQQGAGYNTETHGSGTTSTTHTINHSQSGRPKCPEGESGIYPHPYDCSKFLNCDNGRTFVQDCGPGTVFNPKIKVCDFPYNVDCQNTVEIDEGEEGVDESATEVSHVTTGGGWASQGAVNQGSTTVVQGGSGAQGNYGGSTSSGGVPLVHGGSTGWSAGNHGQGTTTITHGGSQSANTGSSHASQWGGTQGSHGGTSHGSHGVISHGSNGEVSQGAHGGISQGSHGGLPHGSNGGFSQGNPWGGSHWDTSQSTTIHEGSRGRFEEDAAAGQGRWPQGSTSGTQGGSTGQQGVHWTQGSSTAHGQGTTSQFEQGQETQHWPKYINENTPDAQDTVTKSPAGHYITRRPNYSQSSTGRYTNGNQIGSSQWSQTATADYVDTFGTSRNKQVDTEVDNDLDDTWPPPYPSTDLNADYVFEYEDGEEVTLEPENAKEDVDKGSRGCWREDYHCSPDHCIMKTKVCNGIRDCADGSDETSCKEFVAKFDSYQNARLTMLEKERWDNVSASTCALLCLETPKFECKSFNYRKIDNTCFLSDQNIGLSGALMSYYPNDYYELKTASIDCSDSFRCGNSKCIDWNQVCDGSDDCGDRMDEKNCAAEDFGYSIKLAGSLRAHEGRVEVSAFGMTGYVCDDSFGINSANVVCRELGFPLGAADVKKNSFYDSDFLANDIMFMMDDVFCTGNETSLRDCDFSGWGVHNCREEEVVGVVCKTPFEKCPENFWQCGTGNECIPLPFVCDGLFDCFDESDEAEDICESSMEVRLAGGSGPSEGRLEVKHHGVWGTVCDDDFNEDAAKVICRSLRYTGSSTVKKDGHFGPGDGPIWLDQVFCAGNESSLEDCSHWDWGEHNCEHSEDVGVQCSNVNDPVIQKHEPGPNPFDTYNISVYPEECGFRKDAIFLGNSDVHARVIQGTLAEVGDYPWQASIKLRGSGDKAAHWCGAIIISERHVLTAAHCLEGYPKGAYVVEAGDYDTAADEGTEQKAYIDDYFIHEGFRKGHKMNNDIAIIQLKGQGFRLNEDVQAICLPDANVDYSKELNCTISGFGTIRSGSAAYSQNLRAAWIPLIPNDICTMPHVYGAHLTDNMFCAGSLEGGVDACDGDSGGPLACLDNGHFTLYGIISWGQHCGYANRPGVYVKVANYKHWIDDKLKKFSP